MALPGMIIADVEQWEPSALLCENKHEKKIYTASLCWFPHLDLISVIVIVIFRRYQD